MKIQMSKVILFIYINIGNAIRSLSRVMGKLGEDQVKNIATTMISKVIGAKAEFRDVYATCLKTLINEVPREYNKTILPVLSLAITGI
jgi:hypothetical protein